VCNFRLTRDTPSNSVLRPDGDPPTFASHLYPQVQSGDLRAYSPYCDTRVLLSEKASSTAPSKISLRLSLSLSLTRSPLLPPSAPSLARFWLFSICPLSEKLRLLSPTPSSTDAEILASDNTTPMYRGRVEGEKGGGEERAKSPPRGDSRSMLRNERRERELIHCARIPAVISGRRVGRRRRRYRSSFASLFHAPSILWCSPFPRMTPSKFSPHPRSLLLHEFLSPSHERSIHTPSETVLSAKDHRARH